MITVITNSHLCCRSPYRLHPGWLVAAVMWICQYLQIKHPGPILCPWARVAWCVPELSSPSSGWSHPGIVHGPALPGATLEYSLEDHWPAESRTVPGNARMVKPQTGPVPGPLCKDSPYRLQINKGPDSASPFAHCSDHIPSIPEYPSQPVSNSISLPLLIRA